MISGYGKPFVAQKTNPGTNVENKVEGYGWISSKAPELIAAGDKESIYDLIEQYVKIEAAVNYHIDYGLKIKLEDISGIPAGISSKRWLKKILHTQSTLNFERIYYPKLIGHYNCEGIQFFGLQLVFKTKDPDAL